MGGHVSVWPWASVQCVRAVGACGEGLGTCIGGLGAAECGRSGAVAWGHMEVAWGWQVGCGGLLHCHACIID